MGCLLKSRCFCLLWTIKMRAGSRRGGGNWASHRCLVPSMWNCSVIIIVILDVSRTLFLQVISYFCQDRRYIMKLNWAFNSPAFWISLRYLVRRNDWVMNFDFCQKCSYWDSADGWASDCLLDQAQGPYENRGRRPSLWKRRQIEKCG